MADLDIVKAGVCQLAEWYESQQLTPIEITRFYLDQIERLNDELNAFIYVDREGVLSAAEESTKRWQTNRPLSAYDGIPLALKANIGVAGWPWHAGIEAYKDRLAPENAIIINRLQRAGFIFLGLTNMDEGALGASADNSWLGRCYNPASKDRSPGGSSGGSAVAVAAGLCAAAIGTDTMGSVRIPAAYCGVSAHKPSDKLVPTTGVAPLSVSYDSVGALARSITDVKAIMSIISTASLRASTSANKNKKLRIARLNYHSFVNCDRAIDILFDNAVQLLSEHFGEISVIDWPVTDIGSLRRKLLLITEIEAQQIHAEMLMAEPDGFSECFKSMMAFGESKSLHIDQIYDELSVAADQILEALNDFDVVLTPATPQPAFSYTKPDGNVPENQADFSILANLSGLPAAVTNIGKTDDSLPVGLQLLSRPGEGFRAIRVAEVLESMMG